MVSTDHGKWEIEEDTYKFHQPINDWRDTCSISVCVVILSETHDSLCFGIKRGGKVEKRSI